MTFDEAIQKAKIVEDAFKKKEAQNGKLWDRSHIAQGFVGDVGDLMKLVMAKEGLRTIEDTDKKLAHELSDCLWSILILADKYNIDLQDEYIKNMDHIVDNLNKK